jgi:hypothetical protein
MTPVFSSVGSFIIHFVSMGQEQHLDTTPPAVPQEGVPAESAQTAQPNTQPGASEGTKVYAGKYKSVEDLEHAYSNAESKLGQKSYAETLGSKVLELTGSSVEDLQSAGYSPEQIVQAVLSASPTSELPVAPTPAKAESPVHNPFDSIRRTVEETKTDKLVWKQDMFEFLQENPEAKQFRDEINDFHAMPAYRNLTPGQIFSEKLKKFLEKGEQIVQTKQNEKKRATLSVTHQTSPAPVASAREQERFETTRHFDDAVHLIKSRLTTKKNGS